MASGHVNRIYRPNTWLHRPMLQNVKKVLANSEPSTHGTKRTSRPCLRMSVHRGRPEVISASSNRRVWPLSNIVAVAQASFLFDLAALWVNHKFGRCALIHNCDFVSYPAVCLFKASANGLSRTFFFRQSSRRGKID
jgi:hypothetical protein